MECERLNRLIRSWYVQIQDESMAPARMVEFMENHIVDCDVCISDSHVKDEVEKISELVLPSSKMTKAAKKEAGAREADEENAEPAEEEEEETGESLNDEYEEDKDLDPVFLEGDDETADLE